MENSWPFYLVKLYTLRSYLYDCLKYLIQHKNTIPVSDDFDADELNDMIYSFLDSLIYLSDFLQNV